MIHYSSTVTIERSPHEVLAALLDPEMYGQWTEMQDTRFDGSGPADVGTTGSFRMGGGPLKGVFRMELTDVQPDRRLAFHVTHPKMDWVAISDLEPVGPATRLTYAGRIRLKGLWRLLEPLMAGEIRAGEAKEAERLKALLESKAPVTTA